MVCPLLLLDSYLLSYLSNRKHIAFGQGKSCLQLLKTGVPQDSVLGSLLFKTKLNPIFYTSCTGDTIGGTGLLLGGIGLLWLLPNITNKYIMNIVLFEIRTK